MTGSADEVRSPGRRACLPVLRRNVSERLSGDEQLVVIHAPRLMHTTDLLRTWLDTSAPTGAVVLCVLAPSAGIGEEEHWGLLAAELSRGAGDAVWALPEPARSSLLRLVQAHPRKSRLTRSWR